MSKLNKIYEDATCIDWHHISCITDILENILSIWRTGPAASPSIIPYTTHMWDNGETRHKPAWDPMHRAGWESVQDYYSYVI